LHRQAAELCRMLRGRERSHGSAATRPSLGVLRQQSFASCAGGPARLVKSGSAHADLWALPAIQALETGRSLSAARSCPQPAVTPAS